MCHRVIVLLIIVTVFLSPCLRHPTTVIMSHLPCVPLSQLHCVINSNHRVSVNVSLSSFLSQYVIDTGNTLHHHVTVAVSMSPCHRYYHQVTISPCLGYRILMLLRRCHCPSVILKLPQGHCVCHHVTVADLVIVLWSICQSFCQVTVTREKKEEKKKERRDKIQQWKRSLKNEKGDKREDKTRGKEKRK